jgi:hypothetical protein
MKPKKGWGTLSIILFFFGILFTANIGRTFCLGDVLLQAVGLKGELKIDNSTLNIKIYITEIIFIIGLILGLKFKKDFLSKAGRLLCLIFAILLGLMLLYATTVFVSITNTHG